MIQSHVSLLYSRSRDNAESTMAIYLSNDYNTGQRGTRRLRFQLEKDRNSEHGNKVGMVFDYSGDEEESRLRTSLRMLDTQAKTGL